MTTIDTVVHIATGVHIAMARAGLLWSQKELAEFAGVSVGTIKNMEKFKYDPIIGDTETYRRVIKALYDAGADFLNDGHPGVRLRVVPSKPTT